MTYLFDDSRAWLGFPESDRTLLRIPPEGCVECWNPGESLVGLVQGIELNPGSVSVSARSTWGLFPTWQVTYQGSLTAQHASLAISGDVTVEAIVVLRHPAHSTNAAYDLNRQNVVGYGGTSTTEAHNALYCLGLDEAATKLLTFHEYGSGTDAEFSGGTGPAIDVPAYLVLSRAGTVATLYCNGEEEYSIDTVNAPTGGTDATAALYLGNYLTKFATSSAPWMHYLSVAITASAKSASAIEATYNSRIARYFT